MRRTFAAPTLPLPLNRTSIPARRAMRNANGTDPVRYPSSTGSINSMVLAAAVRRRRRPVRCGCERSVRASIRHEPASAGHFVRTSRSAALTAAGSGSLTRARVRWAEYGRDSFWNPQGASRIATSSCTRESASSPSTTPIQMTRGEPDGGNVPRPERWMLNGFSASAGASALDNAGTSLVGDLSEKPHREMKVFRRDPAELVKDPPRFQGAA